MKQLLTLTLALVVSLACADTTSNLMSGTTWTGVTTGSLPANRMPGSSLLYDSATGTVNWSYNTATAAKTIAINNALSGSGVQVGGYNYTYDLRNINGDDRQGSVDTMTVVTKMTSNAGATLLTNTNTHNTKFDWTTFRGSQSLSAPAALGNLGNLSISFTSRDTGYWAGYFGPEVRNVGMSLNYSVDQCSSNPLSSTSCPGYQQAYTDQQCAANPLYATSCAGYAAAYTTQQCSSNPLYSTACPGYPQAFHDYQCSANPLYATDCAGYSQAYHNQQCNSNPLYASDCSGYAAAYAAQQAAILAAQQAAFAAQCSANPLSSVNCPGYAAAYAAQQAAIQQAAFTAQCNANPLSSTSCPGYQVALNKKNATDAAIKQPATVVETVVVSSPTTTSASVPGISDPVVSSAVSAPSTTSTTSPTSPTSVTSVLPQPPSTSTISAAVAPAAPVPAPAPSAETKQEAKKTEGAVAKAVAKGVAAAAKEATATAANAKSMEEQTATQGLVVGLMGYVPGFNAYQNALMPDALAAQVARQYMKPNVDNRNAQRRLSGASDAKWQEMVDSQYKIGDR